MKRLTPARRLGLLMLALLLAATALGTLWWPVDPLTQDLGASLRHPDAQHWLGTDPLGRNVLARLLEATQRSLWLAALTVALAALPGAALGLWASARGGRWERTLVMLADAAQSLPALLLVLLVATLAQGAPWGLAAGLACTLWVEWFRITRAVAGPTWGSEAVQASRLLGFGLGYLLRHHLWPALATVWAALLPLALAQTVLTLAALGFISVGVQPPAAELGAMMIEALPTYDEAPWCLAAPVLVLLWLVAATVLLASAQEAAE